MSRTRAVLASLVLLPALAAAGCGADDPEPKFAPTPTESSPAGVESTPTGSAEVLGPEETVRAWVSAYNQALASGDVSGLETLADQDCQTCARFVNPIADVHAEGGSFRGGRWELEGAKARGGGERRVVDAAVSIAGGRTLASAGADPVTYGPAKHLLKFRMARDGGAWAITFIGFVS